MPLILRFLLVMLASALIMGARLLTRQCLSWQPVHTAAPHFAPVALPLGATPTARA